MTSYIGNWASREGDAQINVSQALDCQHANMKSSGEELVEACFTLHLATSTTSTILLGKALPQSCRRRLCHSPPAQDGDET